MKNHIIRRLASLAIIICAIITAGCSRAPKYRIGVSQCSDDDWRAKMNEEILREALFHDNIEVTIVSADDNSDKQIADIRRFVDEGYDIIIAAPNEADALTPVITEVYQSGIPVIVFDRTIHGDNYTAYQGADNVEIGRMAAATALSLVGEGGSVIEIRGLPGSTPAEGRAEGFDREATRLGLVIAGSGDGNWNAGDAAVVADSLLTLYPYTDIIYAHNDRMAIAAAQVADSLGRDDIMIIGIDAAPNIGIKAVADSVIDATFLYPTEGYHLLRTALDILEGRPYQRETIFASPSVVDSSNADILLLQDQALREETEKVSLLNGKIDSYWRQHSLQTALLYGSIVTVLLLAGVIFLLLRAYWSRNRHNQQIAARNLELARQKEEIAAQRDQLDSLYRQLQEATQSKLTFFTNVSHDLRTPLTLIADPVEQLSQAPNLDPRQQTLMKLANKNVKILMRLINQILDIRKFDNGKLAVNLADTDLAEALGEWTAAFANAARQRHIKFDVDIDTKPMVTAVDLDKIERVVFNLISNAFKFTPENGSITVKASADSHNVTIEVADTGRGIPADEVACIFDRFFKTDNVNPHGSGIGLALTKVFVEMHDGSIAVDSAPDKGSRFTVTLPIRSVGSPAAPAPTATVDASKDIAELTAVDDQSVEADADAAVVLVIDDNPDICTLVKSVLADKYTVVRAYNGNDGIRLASKYIPDLIICDVMMPGIDGFETCRRIKNEVITSHIPVLLLTACSQDLQRIEGYESGADAYMSKPFDSKMLTARCEALIANRRRLLNAADSDTPAVKPADNAATRRDIDDEFYNRFIDLVEAEMANPELSVEDLADRIGMSRVQVYRKIKALTNYSPTEVLRIARLKKASVMLKTTSLTISEVLYAVGFSSPSYFAKCYKEYFNETPSETQARTSRLQ